MKTYIAKQDTYLKKSTKPATELGKGQKHFVPKGKAIKIETVEETENPHYLKVELGYGAGNWLIFLAHWQMPEEIESTVPPQPDGLTFPNGVPRPQNLHNPTITQVVEEIVKYAMRVGVTRLDQVAYILATCEGESNFKPIREYRGKQLTRDQQMYWYTNYMGRGFIQVTWKSNYQKVQNRLGVPAVSNPDILLTYPVAIATLVLGMRDGWYTGKRLNNYARGAYWNMRAIVNPGEIKYKRYHSRAIKFVNNAQKWEKYLIRFKSSLYPWLT